MHKDLLRLRFPVIAKRVLLVKRQGFAIVCFALIGNGAMLLVNQGKALALPFSPDPISFAGYLNSSRGRYDRTLRIRFESLGNCEYNYLLGYEYCTCRIGYARIKDGISERKCRVTVQYDGSSRQTAYNEYECRKVSYEEKGRE